MVMTNKMHNHDHSQSIAKQNNVLKLSLQATWHCLIGCGLGEIAGMIFSTAFNASTGTSVFISIVFGFIGGLGLGISPLLKNNFTLRNAIKIVIVSEGLSILVMEAFEIITQAYIPGVMAAGLTDSLFWIGMIAGLVVGFIAALPVNYFLIKRGVRHHH